MRLSVNGLIVEADMGRGSRGGGVRVVGIVEKRRGPEDGSAGAIGRFVVRCRVIE